MNQNIFHKKFQEKTDSELEQILHDKQKYTEQAINASRQILEERNGQKAELEAIQKEVEQTVQKKTFQMKYISVREDFLMFLKKPDYLSLNELTISEKLIILFKVFILTYIGLLIFSIPTEFLKELGVIDGFDMKTNITYESLKLNHSDFKPYFLFMVILILPILEEFSFRLSLMKFQVNFFKISLSLLSGLIIYSFIGNNLWMPKEYYLWDLTGIFYMLLMSLIVYALLLLNKNKLLKLEKFWNEKPKIIFYIIASFFALLHILNLNIASNQLLYLPILILPFFVFGLTFGYLRIRLGILFSILLHVMVNGLRFGLEELIKH